MLALSGSFECAKFLLEHGARVSGKTIDGKTALHLAAVITFFFFFLKKSIEILHFIFSLMVTTESSSCS